MSNTRPHLPTSMPTSNRPINLGTSVNDDTSRLDGVAKVTGLAKYGRDVYPKNGLFVAFVRCPWGAAELTGYDEDAALAVPGVLEVVIDGDAGRYHGHNLGYLVAESPHAMRRGLDALRPVWTRNEARTQITDEVDGLSAADDETRALLDGADHVLEATYSTPVQTHSALETHGSSVDHQGDRATVYCSTQGTFAARDGLGDALGLPASKFELVCEYVGGGFGSKLNGAGKEGMTAAKVATKYQRPTYLFVNRREDHLDTGNRPSSRTCVRIGFNDDGTILGGQVQTYGGVGVARGGGGVSFPSGRYDLGAVYKSHRDVQFNGGGPRPFRAPGQPQAAFVEELMLDEIATAMNMDPLELRLQRDVQDDRKAMLRRGAELIGWSRRLATGSQTGTLRRGFGLGGTEWGRYPARAAAEVAIHRDGSVEVRTGTQDIGTGQRTAMGVLAADQIGIPLSLVEVRIGSPSLPRGPGSGGSMTAHSTAPAMLAAADDAKRRLLEVVAGEMPPDDAALEIVNGEVTRDGAPVMSWTQACSLLPEDVIVGRGEKTRETLEMYGGKGHSQGAQLVELVVDTETGVIRVERVVAVQACGRVMCRKTAESQIIGGVIQGMSYALFEDKLLDRVTGAMVNPNLEYYKVIGSADMPHIVPVLWADENQTGVRSLGEPPTVPTAGAVACAVYNAIGARVRHLPLTPAKVIAAVEGGGA